MSGRLLLESGGHAASRRVAEQDPAGALTKLIVSRYERHGGPSFKQIAALPSAMRVNGKEDLNSINVQDIAADAERWGHDRKIAAQEADNLIEMVLQVATTDTAPSHIRRLVRKREPSLAGPDPPSDRWPRISTSRTVRGAQATRCR
jgi:hypothetical protein